MAATGTTSAAPDTFIDRIEDGDSGANLIDEDGNGSETVYAYFHGSGTRSIRYRCKLDADSYVSCSSPWQRYPSVGMHTVTVQAYDGQTGASDPTPALQLFTIQPSTTPTSTTTSSGSSTTSPTSADLDFPQLIFDDEFDGTAGSDPTANWDAKQFSGDSANSIAYFDGFNQVFEDGNGLLHIRAVKRADGRWNTGWLSTKPAFAPIPPLEYSVRAKVASGYGMWSAPAWSWSNPYGATNCGQEIDNVEQLGRNPYKAYNTAHSCVNDVTRSATLPSDLSADFHVYTARIYADRIEFLIDGTLYNTITPTDTQGSWPFLAPTTFLITLDVGKCGSWADCPPPDATSGEMLVDWFRVYQ